LSYIVSLVYYDETQNSLQTEMKFPLKSGWILKENQKIDNKEGGKCISKKVIQYLQAYFHVSNLNPKDWYTAEKMHESLKELVNEKELSVEEIPEVKTIKGWIGRYSASSKKDITEKALEENKESAHH
ncbi:hypothetical protein C1645_744184, partial [Glomus cerebriforme]